jgi:prepilin-type N-terminal cleavage/methylation domain-containing protein
MKTIPCQPRLQRGFTLLELTITTAIVGILTALAVPSYQAYVYRARAAEIVLVMDKIHGVLAGLQAEQGSTLGRPIMVQYNRDSSATNAPDAPALAFCVKEAAANSCSNWKPLTGLTWGELTFKKWGVTLSVNSGNEPFNAGTSQYKVSVNEDYTQTKAQPALRATARQIVLAVHQIMKPHTYRDRLSYGKADASTYLYFNMNGTRP